jgi:hypothetical protein
MTVICDELFFNSIFPMKGLNYLFLWCVKNRIGIAEFRCGKDEKGIESIRF